MVFNFLSTISLFHHSPCIFLYGYLSLDLIILSHFLLKDQVDSAAWGKLPGFRATRKHSLHNRGAACLLPLVPLIRFSTPR